MTGRTRLTPGAATAAVVAVVATVACGAAPASALAASGRAPTRARSVPSHLLIYAQEWSLWPSRTHVPAGTIDVELWNRGEDAHDVRVRRLNGSGAMTGPVLAGVPVAQSGAITTAVWHLRAGRYELYCSMPGHLKMGMHTRLTVTSAR